VIEQVARAEHDARTDNGRDDGQQFDPLLLLQRVQFAPMPGDPIRQRKISAMSYPTKRQPFFVHWRARAGATIDTLPLPVRPDTRARDRAIRKIFFDDFHGCARLDDVGAAAEDAGLLDDLRTPRSMREAVLKALRPVATLDGGATPQRPVPVTDQIALG